MSYKYGLNGNDINWDYVGDRSHMCMECAENIFAITNALEEANDNIRFVNRNYNQEIPEADINNAIQDYNDNAVCDMHKTIYFKLKEDAPITILMDEHVATGEWKQYVKWAVIHDSNGNWVDTFGDVPDDIFIDEYLNDKKEAEELSNVIKMIESEPKGVFEKLELVAIAPISTREEIYAVVINTGGEVTPYVRWRYFAGDNHGFYWGHYHKTLGEAMADFAEAVKQEFKHIASENSI